VYERAGVRRRPPCPWPRTGHAVGVDLRVRAAREAGGLPRGHRAPPEALSRGGSPRDRPTPLPAEPGRQLRTRDLIVVVQRGCLTWMVNRCRTDTARPSTCAGRY